MPHPHLSLRRHTQDERGLLSPLNYGPSRVTTRIHVLGDDPAACVCGPPAAAGGYEIVWGDLAPAPYGAPLDQVLTTLPPIPYHTTRHIARARAR